MHNVDPNVLGAIFLGYFVVAGFLFRGAWREGKTRRGFSRWAIGAVFILCAFSGYGSVFLGPVIQVDWFSGFVRLAHWLLLAVLIGLVVMLVMGTDLFGDKE